ncbi:ferredoxin--NADP reductase [Rhodococcus sp. UNC23MFCrub1.1]|uniref:ferredoxin--NADP reductase n=1 Tax=Rhodococcus sp. UNC23MFCrub1.1 TaxID=1449068 RepID=UPI000AD83838|nr:ferredoxin--NADP reductase [Rhodococcus sp. UNC23MFCrub1.1]
MAIDSADTAVRTLRLQVDEVIRETADAVTLVLSTADGEALRYRPGQFLTVEIPLSDGGSAARCYSLSSSPDTGERPAISVKRTAGGLGSTWLCDTATAGSALTTLAPAGTFVPARWDRPLVLVAAGSGITPVMSILKTALASHDGRVVLFYANRDPDSVMFAATLDDLQQQHPDRLTVRHWHESASGLPTATGLTDAVSGIADADAYLCGPGPFMEVAQQGLLAAGVSPENIHREVFTSITTDPFHTTLVETSSATGVPVSAEVEGDDHSFHCAPGTVLLDAMLAEGIDAPFVCREGNCGACAFTLVSGDVHMRVNDTLDQYELDRGVRLACQSVPVSDALTIRID